MGLLNKTYGLVQAGRGVFSLFCEDRFEQSEADQCLFRKFDDEEVEMAGRSSPLSLGESLK